MLLWPLPRSAGSGHLSYWVAMDSMASLYVPGASVVHRLDARVKIGLLLAYSVGLLLVRTWAGLGLMATLFAVALAVSRLPLRRVFGMGLALYVLVGSVVALNGLRGPEGWAVGCFTGARMLLLLWMSYILCLSSTSTQLNDALASLLGPLRRLGVPVDDVALALSLALRFIPEVSRAFAEVAGVQRSRGAHLDEGGAIVRARAWAAVFAPVMTALFHRATDLGVALEARCYGLGEAQGRPVEAPGRTRLDPPRMTARDGAVLAVGCALCALAAVLL